MNTLIDVAVADGHFKTVTQALTAAGRVDTHVIDAMLLPSA